MKLLSVAIPSHDANLSYFDGEKVRYLKLERTRQEKRFSYTTLADWKTDAERAFDVDVGEVDDVVFSFDPGALPAAVRSTLRADLFARIAQDRSKAEPLPQSVCHYLGVAKGWFASHHFSHALSTWMLEQSPPDVQVVIDGVGDGRPWSVYRGERLVGAGRIENGSIGWGMREAGKLLGIRHGHYNDIAGKLMGLQSHGRVDERFLLQLRQLGFEQLKELWSPEPWLAFKGDALVARNTLLDWSATVHQRMGEMLPEFFRKFAAPDEAVSYSGGVAQNVVWNSQIRGVFARLVIPPHASDEGLSLGALEWLRREHGLPRMQMPGFPCVQEDTAVPPPSVHTTERAADLLAQGKVIGWFQGNGEVGPRALGNRSILMDPRLAEGRQLLNRIKKRENYRPFGASVLQEYDRSYFTGPTDEFMLYACKVKTLDFPAITHVDGTCRVQAVPVGSGAFRSLLERFHRVTGCAVVANTSLNVAGRPIASSPADARALFDSGDIDAMVIGDEVLAR